MFNNDVIQKFSFYDAEGALMVKDASNTFSESGSGYIVVNETAYLLDGGKLVTSVPVGRGLDQDFLSYDYKSDNYYFSKNAEYVKIFASDGSFVRSVNTNKYATAATVGTGVFYLSSDRIVVQYENVCPDDAVIYDFLRNGAKENLETYVYNVTGDKWSKKSNFKYFIKFIANASDVRSPDESYDDSVTDIMTASAFSKKSLSIVESMYSVNKNLKVKVKFDDVLKKAAATFW